MKGVLAQPRGFGAGVVRAVEIADLPSDRRVCCTTQTTRSVDETRGMVAALHAKYPDIAGPDVRDICYAAQNRQAAERDLSRVADVILVVGARRGLNANRLRETGSDANVPGYLINNGAERDPSWLDGVNVVVVTAGVSAPGVLVEDVIAALAKAGPIEVSTLPGLEETASFRVPAAFAAQAV